MAYVLCYRSTEIFSIDYNDADWARDMDEHKSTTGYVFLLNGGVVTWACKKQTCIALSMIEAKDIAYSAVVQEVFWLRHFLQDLRVATNDSKPGLIHYNRMAALAYAKDLKYYGRTKHIEVRYNFIRAIVARKKVVSKHISTSQMIAYPLTKPISKDCFEAHAKITLFTQVISLSAIECEQG
ncbi:hypothetical protein CRG98_033760 [Punica granatum]|uniref:Reverse transcriptase Ty1/copia-type domain-containing protein n=1 Tax=Punica granatum TaxID=22663 RepID=A0A2I0IPC1_PUNGR|nr:hypothetical protein CRG98_033760 [Punica granatum]